MPTFVWIRLEIILGLHAKYFSQKAKTDINNVINYSCQFLIVSTTKTAAIPPPPQEVEVYRAKLLTTNY